MAARRAAAFFYGKSVPCAVDPGDPSPRNPPRFWTRLLSSPRWALVGDDGRPRLRSTLERSVLLFALALFSAGVVASLAAATGTFRLVAPLLLVLAVSAVAGIVWLAARRRLHHDLDRYDAVALLITLLSAILAVALNHQAYLAISDTGFYANDALHIAGSGGRDLPRAEDALLPGVDTGPDGKQRFAAMFGYSSLAALAVYVGGLAWLPWASVPFVAVAQLSLYLVGRQLGAKSGALYGLGFYATSLMTVWFHRYFMTEVAATAVFWTVALLALPLLHRWDTLRAAALVPALAFGALVRPEGILVAAWVVGVVGARWGRHAASALRGLAGRIRAGGPTKTLAAAAAVLLLGAVAVWQLAVRLPTAYLASGADLVGRLLRGRVAADAYDVPTSGPSPNWGDYALRFEWDAASGYYLPWFLAVLALALLLRLAPWRRFAWLALLAVPYLLFVLMPPVTPQQPWFMRRYWVALVPLLYLGAGVGLDFHRASWRWPAVRRQRPRPRWDGGIVAAIVALVLLVPHLDVVSPVMFKRENDGSVYFADEMERLLPPDAIVILDDNAAGFASLIRFEQGRTVVPWHASASRSLEASLRLSDRSANVYLVRANDTVSTVLTTDPSGASGEPVVLRVPSAGIPGTPLRLYLTNPPLLEGYRPFAVYLDAVLPPDRWRDAQLEYFLVPLRGPTVFQKNVRFDEGWNRTDLGLMAGDGAILSFDRDLFFGGGLLANRSLVLHVAYVQAVEGSFLVEAGNESERVPLALFPSNGSGALRFGQVQLPENLAYDRLLVEKNTILRGALVDLG